MITIAVITLAVFLIVGILALILPFLVVLTAGRGGYEAARDAEGKRRTRKMPPYRDDA